MFAVFNERKSTCKHYCFFILLLSALKVVFVVSCLPGIYKDTYNQSKHRCVCQGSEARPHAGLNAKFFLVVSCFLFYRPQTKFAKVMILQVSVCPRGEGSLSTGGCLCSGGISVWRFLSRVGSLSWRPPIW